MRNGILLEVHHVFHAVVFYVCNMLVLPTPRKTLSEINMSSDQSPGYLLFIYGIIVPSYVGFIRSHFKDHDESISMMECHEGFEC